MLDKDADRSHPSPPRPLPADRPGAGARAGRVRRRREVPDAATKTCSGVISPAIPSIPGSCRSRPWLRRVRSPCCPLPENRGKIVLFGGIEKVRFRRQVVPGDTMRFEVELSVVRGPGGQGRRQGVRGRRARLQRHADVRRGRRRLAPAARDAGSAGLAGRPHHHRAGHLPARAGRHQRRARLDARHLRRVDHASVPASGPVASRPRVWRVRPGHTRRASGARAARGVGPAAGGPGADGHHLARPTHAGDGVPDGARGRRRQRGRLRSLRRVHRLRLRAGPGDGLVSAGPARPRVGGRSGGHLAHPRLGGPRHGHPLR